jgi:hypothetical protein
VPAVTAPDGARASRAARPQPARRVRGPAVNAGKIRRGRAASSRRSPRRPKSGPVPAQAGGRHARAPAAPAERDEKLKIPCNCPGGIAILSMFCR